MSLSIAWTYQMQYREHPDDDWTNILQPGFDVSVQLNYIKFIRILSKPSIDFRTVRDDGLVIRPNMKSYITSLDIT